MVGKDTDTKRIKTMKMYCFKCDRLTDIVISPSGPHLKATCPEGHYIKFMNKQEKKKWEQEEDKKD